MAYALTKLALLYVDDQHWIEDFPLAVESLIMGDCPILSVCVLFVLKKKL